MTFTRVNEQQPKLTTDPLIGQVIDRYRLVEAIGDGAMANVYRAQHTTLTDRRYAVKVLRPNMARKPQVAARFRREARILSQIEHPNIVSVIDAGTTSHGLLYMVLEYAEGKTLKGLIKETGPMGVERAADLTRQIASALTRVHSMGYIHRDIKPDNIVITRHEGREIVKILDFGIAGVIEEDVDATRLTEVNRVCGTPHYMAPEQASAGEISAPVDIYAIGAILYELLTGQPPFVGPMSEVLVQKLVADPKKPDFHGGLGPLSIELLSRKAEDRPTAVNLIEQLDRLQAAGWTQVRAHNVVPMAQMRSARPSIVRTMLAAGVAGFVAVGGFAAMMNYQDAAATEATAVAVLVPAPAPAQVVKTTPVAAPEKKVVRKKRRVVRKKAKARRKAVVKSIEPSGGELSDALARLTEKKSPVEAKPTTILKKYVSASSTKRIVIPTVEDTASSRSDVTPARSQKNLPDSVQVSNAGGRLSSSSDSQMKQVRRKAFSRSKRSSAYRMSR